MNTQDKITQLYQDAFNDYSVEAPASAQAGALKQLGRKSLLTIDPTRFNVFYMALISGALVWAILGVDSENLAHDSEANQTQAYKVDSKTTEANSKTFSSIEASSVALQSENTALITHSSAKISEVVSSQSVASKAKNTWTKPTYSHNQESQTEQSVKESFTEPLNELEINSIAEQIESPKEITPIQADLESSWIDLVDPVSLVGARMQNPTSFMRQVILDSDNKLSLKVYK